LRLPPAEAEDEMRKELALALYVRGALGFGKARALARLSTWEFDDLLGGRGVVHPYGKDDLEMDLSYAPGRSVTPHRSSSLQKSAGFRCWRNCTIEC